MKQKNKYDEHCFYQQLKKARLYRGHKTQVSLCKKVGVSRQVYSFWELNKRRPSYRQLITLAEVMKLKICYFFTADAIPEDYEFISETVEQQTKVQELSAKSSDYENPPFHNSKNV